MCHLIRVGIQIDQNNIFWLGKLSFRQFFNPLKIKIRENLPTSELAELWKCQGKWMKILYHSCWSGHVHLTESILPNFFWVLGFRAKNPVFQSKSSEKFGKKFGKVRKSSVISETGFSNCLEILEIWKFRTFRKLRKNGVLFELRKLRNIRSDSETDPKVRLKVRNAGP